MKISIVILRLTIGIFLTFCENASGVDRQLITRPEKRTHTFTHMLIPYKYTFINVWKKPNGGIASLYRQPKNDWDTYAIHKLNSYHDEVGDVSFRVYEKHNTIFAVLYEPPRSASNPSGHSVTYNSGEIYNHDNTIFKLQQNPRTGKVEDIVPEGFEDHNNYFPTFKEISDGTVTAEKVTDYPHPFVVFKSRDGKVIGSRLV